MAEVESDVKPRLLEYRCDKCKLGYMKFTGRGKPGNPPQLLHICDKCGNQQLLDKDYPKVDFKKIEGTEKGKLIV